MPSSPHWCEAAKPGGYAHITIEEAHAKLWSMESRLGRPSEFGTRVLHGGDNAACEGAFMKGRSASTRLNTCCQQGTAIVIAGNLVEYHFWVASARNPADAPSSVYGIRAGRTAQPLPIAEVLLPPLPGWAAAELGVLLLCSGPMGPHDVGSCVRAHAHAAGLSVAVVYFDPCVSHEHDLTARVFLTKLQDDVSHRRFRAALASPPCSTVSAARHVPLRNGPRPLRPRDDPFDHLPGLDAAELKAWALGTHLALACMDIMGRIAEQNGWVAMEHPADRKRVPYPSFFHSREMTFLLTYMSGIIVTFHQCRFGAPSVKPTSLATNDTSARSLELLCNHRGGHPALIGLDASGHWRTTPAARYPLAMCDAIGGLMSDWLVSTNARPPHDRPTRWTAPWAHRLFPAELPHGHHAGSLPGGQNRFQQ
jgi:hypothetical protein